MAAGSGSGWVVLAGAGPGDDALVTAASLRWLARCDTVVYDRLANPALLEAASGSAERIYVGKAPGRSGYSQEQINELLVEKCRAGRRVVRLKGGDPLVFGRGGEEADALRAAGCEFRFVPGVTAGVAGLAYAGIPLTDRRLASTAAFITGHEDPAKDESTIAWDALAKIDTLVFYMGVGNLPQIAERLIAAGRSPATPAAVIYRATTPDQRTVTATLAEIAAVAMEADIRPPALIVVGEVVSLRERLNWWETLPLFAQTVLVTRSRAQASRLSAALRELGAGVIESPTIRIEPPADLGPLEAALRRVGEFDWLVLTSPNGVAAVLDRLDALGLDGRALGGVKIAAVGAATAATLAERFIKADLVPAEFTTDALASALTSAGPLTGKRMLLARADIAPPALAEALTVAGAKLDEVVAYRTVRPDSLGEDAGAALKDRRVDWITFTSSSTVENFLALAGELDLSGVKLAAIGPVTAATLQAAGLTPTVVAQTHTIDALVEAMAAFGA